MRASARRANPNTALYEQHACHVGQRLWVNVNMVSGIGSADSE